MARYLGLIIFALSTIIMDCFLLSLVAKVSSEAPHRNVRASAEHGEFVALDETPKVVSGASHDSRVLVINMLLLGHGGCTLILTYTLHRQLRRDASSQRWLEEEVRAAKAEAECALAALFQKTSEQMKWLRIVTDSVQELENALKKKHTGKDGTRRDGLHLN